MKLLEDLETTTLKEAYHHACSLIASLIADRNITEIIAKCDETETDRLLEVIKLKGKLACEIIKREENNN